MNILIDFIFSFLLELIPTLLSETIFGKFFDAVDNRIHSKFLKIVIYSIVLIISVAITIGLAIVIIFFLGWFLIKLHII